MIIPTPLEFWTAYCEALRARGFAKAFEDDGLWTRTVAIPAAKEVCEEMGLVPQPEYFRIDVPAYEGSGFDWYLRIAFEHENKDDWQDELCKLSHVVADLRVLATFYNNDTPYDPKQELQKAVDVLGERPFRVPHSAWLFVFGPRKARLGDSFLVFTLQGRIVVPLAGAPQLCPAKWYPA